METLYKGFGDAPVQTTESNPNSELKFTESPQPHHARRRAIQKAHPEVEDLMHPRADSALYVWGCVIVQVIVAGLLQQYSAPWWAVGLAAYIVGAVADHMLWVLIHDLGHDAVFESTWWNNAYHLIANLPIIFPAAITFKYYHQQHHAKLNEAYGDPDVPSAIENRIFGRTTIGKALWLLFFAILQTVRVLRYKPGLGGLEKWCVANWVAQLSFDFAVWRFMGTTAFVYMFFSSIFSIGLHPLGARWIAEHYSVTPDQETYSYYGSANFFNLNVGYHNEHHDLPSIPWQNLPRLKAMAPEFYNTLWYHTSYYRLLWDFITSSAFTLESRIVRRPKTKGVPGYMRNDSVKTVSATTDEVEVEGDAAEETKKGK